MEIIVCLLLMPFMAFVAISAETLIYRKEPSPKELRKKQRELDFAGPRYDLKKDKEIYLFAVPEIAKERRQYKALVYFYAAIFLMFLLQLLRFLDRSDVLLEKGFFVIYISTIVYFFILGGFRMIKPTYSRLRAGLLVLLNLIYLFVYVEYFLLLIN